MLTLDIVLVVRERERAWMYNLACESDLTPLSSNVLFGIHFIFWFTWTFNVNQNGYLMRSIPPLCSRDAVMFQCTFLRINFLLFLYGTQLNFMCSLQFIKLTGYLRVRLMSSVLCADCSDTRVLTLTCIPCTYIYIYIMQWIGREKKIFFNSTNHKFFFFVELAVHRCRLYIYIIYMYVLCILSFFVEYIENVCWSRT